VKTPGAEGLRAFLPLGPELMKSAELSPSWAFAFLSILERKEEVMISFMSISHGGAANSFRPNGSSL